MKDIICLWLTIVFITCAIFAGHRHDENEKLTSDLKYTMDQFNKMSVQAKHLQERNEELERANIALITVYKP